MKKLIQIGANVGYAKEIPDFTSEILLKDEYEAILVEPNPKSLNNRAKTKPAKPPVMALGAKIPPMPPLSMVSVVATTLRSIMNTRNITKNQTLSLKT